MTFQYFFFDTYSGYFILALPIAVIIAAVYGIIRFRKDKSTPFLRKVFSCLFVCYMVGLVELVLVLDVLRVFWYWIIYHMDCGVELRFFDMTFNLIPDFWHHINSEVIGNLLMFIPFGILYSLAKKNPSIKNTILTGFICTLSIEVLQPVFGRAFDINDVILNTVGVVAGTVVFFCVHKLVSKEKL